jgi:hypothetical protein
MKLHMLTPVSATSGVGPRGNLEHPGSQTSADAARSIFQTLIPYDAATPGTSRRTYYIQ